MKKMLDSFGTRSKLKVDGETFSIFSIGKLGGKSARLPYSLKVLLENLLRHEDGETVNSADVDALINWDPKSTIEKEISFMPARVLLQDFTGVPAVVDLAVMRDAIKALGGDPKKINPLLPCDLVIDHSLQVDSSGRKDSMEINTEKEFQRNNERYEFLKWGQEAFDNFRVVPPATGICHQVNLEYLANLVCTSFQNGEKTAYPDTLVGTDSHTTMINGLGVLGWGVGGIEAEAAMLGEPIGLLIPKVVGFKLTGKLNEGATATDLVLTITKMLRKHGVVGKFVEFYGEGIGELSLADRATVSNMSPEYGATCAIFPVDDETINFLDFTGRDKKKIRVAEAYLKETGLFLNKGNAEPLYSEALHLDISTVEPSLAGPKRPQEHVKLSQVKSDFLKNLPQVAAKPDPSKKETDANHWGTEGGKLVSDSLTRIDCEHSTECRAAHGSVVIAAITSCTNTSNPAVMIGAGLLAKKAVEAGLKKRPWVKSSFAPGSKVVTDYLEESGLLNYLERLEFNIVGYGCTTCIGNSGPICEKVAKAVEENGLVVASVLSGNRNFEGRIHPSTRANYLASPLLVVAYALAGKIDIDLTSESLGRGKNGKDIFLKDIWPTNKEINSCVSKHVKREMFLEEYSKVYEGDDRWQKIKIETGELYGWSDKSTYIKSPPFFENMPQKPALLKDLTGMHVLAVLGDSITTDHISPAGSIKEKSPAGKYLTDLGITKDEFNSYGSRRGNFEVMTRGTFANIRLKNLMLSEVEGGFTLHPSSKEPISIYDAAMKYRGTKTPLLVMGGKEYGSGSSRDWAAKGTNLLGVKAVIAESFERIHRSNLIGMGIIPLQFEDGKNAKALNLTGFETYDITGISDDLKPMQKLKVTATSGSGQKTVFNVKARVDTKKEVTYLKHGGILHYVLRTLK